jgi:hypothetical protein
MNTQDTINKNKVGLLRLARELGNVGQVMGFSGSPAPR